MALSSEPKMKLNLKSGFSIPQATQTPPVGLKINHGKPNYTINRGISRSDSIRSQGVAYNTSPFGVTLKKTSSPATTPTETVENGVTNEVTNGVTNGVSERTPSPPISPKPVITSRTFSTPTRTTPVSSWIPNTTGPKEPSQVILRSTSRASTYSNGSQNGEDEEPEFLRAHRRMAAKISNVDYDEINKNRNSYTEIMNVSSPRISSNPIVPEVETVPELDAASNVEVIENGHQDIIEEKEEVVEEKVVCNGNTEEKVEEKEVICEEKVEVKETVCEEKVEDVEEKATESEEPKTTSFAEQLNELMARGPPNNNNSEVLNEENKDEIQKQVDQTIEEAIKEVEKKSLVDENGNTLPEDLGKLKFDIQQEQEDITVTTTIVH